MTDSIKKIICKYGGRVAAFPGRGSDDAVEQADGRMQTGCCRLWLPVKFEQNHIFPCSLCIFTGIKPVPM